MNTSTIGIFMPNFSYFYSINISSKLRNKLLLLLAAFEKVVELTMEEENRDIIFVEETSEFYLNKIGYRNNGMQLMASCYRIEYLLAVVSTSRSLSVAFSEVCRLHPLAM